MRGASRMYAAMASVSSCSVLGSRFAGGVPSGSLAVAFTKLNLSMFPTNGMVQSKPALGM